MLAMMEHKEKKTNLPFLKYNFFAFMKVFIAYISISLFYLVIVLMGQKGGFLSNALASMPDAIRVKIAVAKIGYVVVGLSLSIY